MVTRAPRGASEGEVRASNTAAIALAPKEDTILRTLEFERCGPDHMRNADEVNRMGELPKRKHVRLNHYDYSQSGYYYVTICTENNLPILSVVGRGLAPAEIALTPIGETCRAQLLALEDRYGFVRIDKYVIMPTHIHAIIVLDNAAGASPRPTLTDIICAFKSLSTRLCNRQDGTPGRKILQASFYEEIIRNEEAYLNIWRYIDENPAKWEEDCYYHSVGGTTNAV